MIGCVALQPRAQKQTRFELLVRRSFGAPNRDVINGVTEIIAHKLRGRIGQRLEFEARLQQFVPGFQMRQLPG